MNRRLSGDASLNAPLRADAEGERRVAGLAGRRLPDQEERLAESEELDNRRQLLRNAMDVLNDRERRIFEARRLAEDPITLEELSTEFGVSPRARPPDRGPRLREGAEGGEEGREGAREAPRPARGGGRLVPAASSQGCHKGRPVAALFRCPYFGNSSAGGSRFGLSGAETIALASRSKLIRSTPRSTWSS